MNDALDTPLRMIDLKSAANSDTVLPFQVDALDVRGRTVQLGPALNTLLERHAYPPAVSRILGEATILTSLLGTALKFEGRFQLQTRTDGPIDLLVVDFEAPDKLRGYARFNAERVKEVVSQTSSHASLSAQLLGHGHLALTLDQGPHMNQYQGIVALEGQGLEEAAHQYFRQSEQIPTRLRVAVGEILNGEGPAHSWRGGGILVQFLPVSPERQRQADFDPGDAPEGVEAPKFVEDNAWLEARSLVETIEDHELLDPALSSERLLYRLFHERGVRVFEAMPVSAKPAAARRSGSGKCCRGSTRTERSAMVADDGRIGVTCEFCSKHYSFDPAEFGK